MRVRCTRWAPSSAQLSNSRALIVAWYWWLWRIGLRRLVNQKLRKLERLQDLIF